MPYRRRRRFSSAPRVAVMQSTQVAKRKSTCRACNLTFEQGETVARLRLRKSFRNPCSTCGHKLSGVRWYHTACVPADINKAMGYDPNATHTPPPIRPSAAHQVAPPPKPQTAMDAQLGALLAIENALRRRMAENPALEKNEELASALKKYNGCKMHALRGANDNEAKTGLKMALKRALDIVL